jgi:hypothetical protein
VYLYLDRAETPDEPAFGSESLSLKSLFRFLGRLACCVRTLTVTFGIRIFSCFAESTFLLHDRRSAVDKALELYERTTLSDGMDWPVMLQ